MPRLLIIAITRLGDLIQCGPFIRRLRLRCPNARIDLLVESSFKDVADLLPDVDEILTISVEQIIAGLGQGHRQHLSQAVSNHTEIVRSLQANCYDEVWNLTHTKPAAALAFIIGGANARGVTWSKQGTQQVKERWLKYFFATNLARPWCQFNLVDIYANCVDGVPWSVHRSLQLQEGSAQKNMVRTRPGGNRIALHVGASTATKRWSMRGFHNLSKQLQERIKAEIVLIGSAKDAQLAATLTNQPRVINLLGKTTVAQLAAELRNCDLLITNDSGPMHVAAAVGTPVICLALGSATGWETAPYGCGHLIFEPGSATLLKSSQHSELGDETSSEIDGVDVYKGALALLNNADVTELTTTFRTARCDVYQTGFSALDKTLELRTLTCGSRKSRLNSIFRGPWLQLLEPELSCNIVEPALTLEEQNQLRAIQVPLAQCQRIINNMVMTWQRQEPRAISDMRGFSKELADKERDLDNLLDDHSPLQAVRRFIQLTKGSLDCDDLGKQLSEMRQVYDSVIAMLNRMAMSSHEFSHQTSQYEGGVPCAYS